LCQVGGAPKEPEKDNTSDFVMEKEKEEKGTPKNRDSDATTARQTGRETKKTATKEGGGGEGPLNHVRHWHDGPGCIGMGKRRTCKANAGDRKERRRMGSQRQYPVG